MEDTVVLMEVMEVRMAVEAGDVEEVDLEVVVVAVVVVMIVVLTEVGEVDQEGEEAWGKCSKDHAVSLSTAMMHVNVSHLQAHVDLFHVSNYMVNQLTGVIPLPLAFG